MEFVLYILIAILVFGFLIFIHEFGHYIFARIFKVKITEFSLGMGPKIVSKKSKKTEIVYSLRAFPIGGFVNMVGEDEESNEPGALNLKPVWQRLIITVAGALMNLIIGFIIISILVLSLKSIYGTTITYFGEGATSNEKLQVGDEIVQVGPRKVYIGNELAYAISRFGGDNTDIVVIRNGEKVELTGVVFKTEEESGMSFGIRDFALSENPRTFFTVTRHIFRQSVMSVQSILDSLIDLIRGRVGFEQMSGPVGITQAIGETASTGDISSVFFMIALISINLGIFNLLPIPALDGGRIFFMLIELIFRKPVDRKIEGYIHFVGIVLLLAMMAAVTLKDILYLFK